MCFQSVIHERSISNRLQMTLQRIRSNLIVESPVPGAPPTDPEDDRVRGITLYYLTDNSQQEDDRIRGITLYEPVETFF